MFLKWIPMYFHLPKTNSPQYFPSARTWGTSAVFPFFVSLYFVRPLQSNIYFLGSSECSVSPHFTVFVENQEWVVTSSCHVRNRVLLAVHRIRRVGFVFLPQRRRFLPGLDQVRFPVEYKALRQHEFRGVQHLAVRVFARTVHVNINLLFLLDEQAEDCWKYS